MALLCRPHDAGILTIRSAGRRDPTNELSVKLRRLMNLGLTRQDRSWAAWSLL